MAEILPLLISPLSAFWSWIKGNIWEPFWWVILMAIVFWVPFLRPWWWIFAPMFLSIELRKLYLWWIAWDFDYPKIKWVMLEIIPPKEVLVPIKAMEDIFSILFNAVSDQANFREIWCDGRLENTPDWMSFEIVSIEGEIHFFARVNSNIQSILETALYSHYPELEIHEASDYVKSVPQDIPNNEWDVYGEDFILGRESAYPIKTYEKFFEPQGEKISAEEKRIEPMNSLLESLAKLGQGEQYWMQIIIHGLYDKDEPGWKEEGKKIIDKLSKRPTKKKKGLISEIIGTLLSIILGPTKEELGGKTKSVISDEGEREMVLTPGEREIITEVENKLKKPVFRTNIRGLYIAKRENWNPLNRVITRGYMSHFSTNNMNFLRFGLATRTKVHDILRKRRVFLRARKIFNNAVSRLTPLFPDRRSECAILNAEELATIFHFPIKITGITLPNIVRVESKKGGPPANLPID